MLYRSGLKARGLRTFWALEYYGKGKKTKSITSSAYHSRLSNYFFHLYWRPLPCQVSKTPKHTGKANQSRLKQTKSWRQMTCYTLNVNLVACFNYNFFWGGKLRPIYGRQGEQYPRFFCLGIDCRSIYLMVENTSLIFESTWLPILPLVLSSRQARELWMGWSSSLSSPSRHT